MWSNGLNAALCLKIIITCIISAEFLVDNVAKAVPNYSVKKNKYNVKIYINTVSLWGQVNSNMKPEQ